MIEIYSITLSDRNNFVSKKQVNIKTKKSRAEFEKVFRKKQRIPENLTIDLTYRTMEKKNLNSKAIGWIMFTFGCIFLIAASLVVTDDTPFLFKFIIFSVSLYTIMPGFAEIMRFAEYGKQKDNRNTCPHCGRKYDKPETPGSYFCSKACENGY